MKTGSKVANHPAFLAKVYKEAVGSEVRGFWMASTAVCNEEHTKTPQCDPRSHHFHQELPITHLGLISPCRRVSWQNRGPPSLLFVCHLLTSPQPHHALLIRAVMDKSKCQIQWIRWEPAKKKKEATRAKFEEIRFKYFSDLVLNIRISGLKAWILVCLTIWVKFY